MRWSARLLAVAACAALSCAGVSVAWAYPTGGFAIWTIAGTGTRCNPPTDACGDGGAATSANLAAPGGVAVDGAGNVYIADAGDNRIRKVSGATITTIAGTGAEGAELCRAVVERNGDAGVTWIHSYVSADKKKTFCVYEGPSPEAIRKTAASNGLPLDRITEVRVLNPYFL